MTLLDKRFFVIYTGCLMTLDVNAQVLVITKEVMAQCFFNEPASAFERCCKEKAVTPDNVVKTIVSSIASPLLPGSRACGVGTKFNSKTNKCEKVGRQINCNAGQYLPANAMSCTDCRSRYYLCVGGMYAPSTHDQGMKKCPYGQVADYDVKQCIDEHQEEGIKSEYNKEINQANKQNIESETQRIVNLTQDVYDISNGSGKDFIEAKELITLLKNKVEESRRSTSEAKKACEYECNGHAWCKFDEEKMICNHAIDLSGTAEEKALYESFISDSGGVEWDKETNKFVCKRNTEYSKLKDQDWHWNREIGTCSYTYNGEEYLSAITDDNMYYVLSTNMKYPWQHNKIWDHSKDESFCKSIHSSCKYEYVYKGIPKCTCETSDKQFRWVYGQRKCEYCEKVSGKMKCTNMFSSENTHWLEGCLDSLAGDRDVVVKF